MTSFLKRIIIFVGLFLMLNAIYASFFKINFLPKMYVHWLFAADCAKTPTEASTDVLIMGDSRVFYGLNPNAFDSMRVERISMEAARPFEIFYLFKEYLKNKKTPPKILFLSFAPDHLAIHDDFWKYTTRFGTIPFSASLRFINKANDLDDLAILERSSYLQAVSDLSLRAMGSLKYYLADYQKTKLVRRRAKNKQAYEELEEERYVTDNRLFSPSKSSIEERNNLKISPTLEFYLKEIVRIAEEHDIKVLFEALPSSKQMAQKRTETYEQPYKAFLMKMQTQFPNARFSDALPFFADTILFRDAGHLNAEGATYFSKGLARRLRMELAQEPKK